MIKKMFFFIVVGLSLFQSCHAEQELTHLYAIRYGTSTFSTKELFFEPEEIGSVPFHWLFYLVVTPEKIILVDTGFQDQSFARLFAVDLKSSEKILEEIGYTPDQITDVIITHGHFDHIGSVDVYTNARIHITKKAFDYYMKQNQLPNVSRFLTERRNMKLYENSYKLDDVIDVHEINGHSPGSCVVYLNFNEEKILLTGDEAYVDENIMQRKPIGSAINLKANKQFIVQAASEKTRFFTFHSPNIVTGAINWREIQNSNDIR